MRTWRPFIRLVTADDVRSAIAEDVDLPPERHIDPTVGLMHLREAVRGHDHAVLAGNTECNRHKPCSRTGNSCRPLPTLTPRAVMTCGFERGDGVKVVRPRRDNSTNQFCAPVRAARLDRESPNPRSTD